MKKFRLAEVFGPTVQGEGRNIGAPCYFIRLGGCDSRCTWCDTPYAVLPEFVNKLPMRTVEEIYNELIACTQPVRTADWVVVSGGNPALFDLSELIAMLRGDNFRVMIETQGTVFKEWMYRVDELCISPKPPSSGNHLDEYALKKFMDHFYIMPEGTFPEICYFKVVVFDDADYEYAREVRRWYPYIDMFMSVGNSDPSLPTVGDPHPDMQEPVPLPDLRNVLCDTYRILVEENLKHSEMRDVRVFPQLHVLAWGNTRGR